MPQPTEVSLGIQGVMKKASPSRNHSQPTPTSCVSPFSPRIPSFPTCQGWTRAGMRTSWSYNSALPQLP